MRFNRLRAAFRVAWQPLVATSGCKSRFNQRYLAFSRWVCYAVFTEALSSPSHRRRKEFKYAESENHLREYHFPAPAAQHHAAGAGRPRQRHASGRFQMGERLVHTRSANAHDAQPSVQRHARRAAHRGALRAPPRPSSGCARRRTRRRAACRARRTHHTR